MPSAAKASEIEAVVTAALKALRHPKSDLLAWPKAMAGLRNGIWAIKHKKRGFWPRSLINPLFLVWQVQREIVPWFGHLYLPADEQLSSKQALEGY
jgi:hypothetical protein